MCLKYLLVVLLEVLQSLLVVSGEVALISEEEEDVDGDPFFLCHHTS